MSDPPPKLKHPTGWFAAGREVTHALELLSDGAFKLYVYICLHADRRTGAEFRVNRSPISRESDHRFHPKAINVFTGKRSRISRDSDHSIGSVKTVIAII